MAATRPRGDRAPEERRYYKLERKVWSLLAPLYDASGPLLSAIRERVVDLAAAPDGSRILDIATGTGKQALAFAKHGYDTVGIDLSDAMLRVAVRKSVSEKAHFVIADATMMPFPDGVFDVAAISFALHEMPVTVMRRALAEAARVIRTGGQLIVIDYALPGSRVASFLVYNFVKLYEGRYYADFIKLDVRELLSEFGIKVTAERAAISGAVAIKKGIREK
ncbi:MAG: methyltransferase domain-containing protein [Chloroflexi bacterium]|nr:methyltransferase domain-containing protein [Chloroflexota bacterium]